MGDKYGLINQLNYLLGAQRYLIVVQNLNENEETTIDSTAASLSVIGLMPGTHYEMRVISIGALSVTNINQSVSARAQTGKT